MSDFSVELSVAFILGCMAFNICRWVYGRTLSDTYPGSVVAIIMLSTLVGFFIAFKLIFVESITNFFPPYWGYENEIDEFVPYAVIIAHVLAGVFTIGMSVLFYKDEGKVTHSEYRETYKDRAVRRGI